MQLKGFVVHFKNMQVSYLRTATFTPDLEKDWIG